MPAFQLSLPRLRQNAQLLHDVATAADCRIVLALKGFSTWAAFPAFRDLLDGCCASGAWEAELAYRHFGKHILIYSPVYTETDIKKLVKIAHHIDFNSLTQWERHKNTIRQHPRFLSGELKCGLRINPECSTGHTPLYDPCAKGSRLGIKANALQQADLSGISGLHFHTLCEQNADDLALTLNAVQEHFGWLLEKPEITWLNMGGGHWITKPFYNKELLIELVKNIKKSYVLDIWLEPGEALAIHTGVLRCSVQDVFTTGDTNIALLDISASAHTPDVLEMPYRPDVFLVEPTENKNSRSSLQAQPALTHTGEHYLLATNPLDNDTTRPYSYRLGAPTCLAGDIFGDYSFPRPLRQGDILVFDDMAHYTMVKTTMFNGVPHPDIELVTESGNITCVRHFTYEDFESRLS